MTGRGFSVGEGQHDDRATVRALSPARRWTLWAIVAVLLVILAVVGWHVALHGVEDPEPLVVVPAAVFALAMLLRGVVAVVVDPAEGTVLLFRAAGGAVRTRPERIVRIDHGPHFTTCEPSYSERIPWRIVTLDGTARLSWLFPDTEEVAVALAELNPAARVEW